MLNPEGHVLHIDFGFILGDSPGFNINFENAPFKLTREYIDVMGGLDTAAFKTFEDLFVKGFLVLQKHQDALCALVEVGGVKRVPRGCSRESGSKLFMLISTWFFHPIPLTLFGTTRYSGREAKQYSILPLISDRCCWCI